MPNSAQAETRPRPIYSYLILGAALFAFIALPDRADDDPAFEIDGDADLFDAVLEPQLAYVDA